jgi:archaeosortase C (PEF-CTERM variant)
MSPKKSELLIFLFAIFVVSAFIELTYGFPYLGIAFFILSVIMLLLLSRRAKVEDHTLSIPAILVGLLVVLADLIYNYIYGSEIRTFDSMVILLGVSIALSGSGTKYSNLGRFSTYFSSIFLVLFLSLFIIPEQFNFDLPYYYGHYAVTLPVALMLMAMGLRVTVPEKKLIEIFGVQHTILKIDLACFGWYSMLLIVSMLLAYTLTIERLSWRRLMKILAIMAFASYLANLVRVSLLVALAYHYGVDTMMLIHPHLGWILFALILIPMVHFFLKE